MISCEESVEKIKEREFLENMIKNHAIVNDLIKGIHYVFIGMMKDASKSSGISSRKDKDFIYFLENLEKEHSKFVDKFLCYCIHVKINDIDEEVSDGSI